MAKLNWSTHDVANTPTHSYRVEINGNSISVIYGKKGEQQMQYNDLDSAQAAKQWAQNYDDKFGEGNDV